MFTRTVLLVIIAFDFTSIAYSQQIDYKGFPEWSWHKEDSTEYYLYTPAALKKEERYPIALFLHGCCGTSYKATLRNAVDPPVRMWHNFGANTQEVPTYIISPATSRGWRQHIDRIKKVIDDLVQNHQGDPKRIYISGFSMGGDGTIAFVERYPELFAAALPMGMGIRADLGKIKDVPIWTNKGETDWYARTLNKSVAEIRKLNGDEIDSSANHITGVNPRLTEFKGVGHGVQWIAASTQDLTGWAYTKVNDGNKYPVVFFKEPAYNSVVNANSKVTFDVEAHDADGTISSVSFYINGALAKKVSSKPYSITVGLQKGDSKVDAVAIDNMGKTSAATTILRVSIPVTITVSSFPAARQGDFYTTNILAKGNGTILYSLVKDSTLPAGLHLLPSGMLRGVPQVTGSFKVGIEAKDRDGDVAVLTATLTIEKKDPSKVVVKNVKSYSGKPFPVSVLMPGEPAHGDRGDNEVTVSRAGAFSGMTLIQTDANDTINASPHYLEFEVDEDVTVYVAYEKLDNLFTSTIPLWLKEFKKAGGDQIVAQYFYYDVYQKDFPKGKITLPDAEEKRNGVNTNYFVMVKKKGVK